MNFLMLRPSQPPAPAPTPTPTPTSTQEFQAETNYVSKASATLEGLITQDPFQTSTSAEGSDGVGRENGDVTGSNDKNNPPIVENHIDVSEDEGWITIPYKELPDNWSEAADILSLQSLDRLFLFPGEQVHILACLSASNQDTEILTPFKVAAAMNKKGSGQSTLEQNGNNGYDTSPVSRGVDVGPDGYDIDQNDDDPAKGKIDQQKDVSAGESILKLEVHKRQTETLLRRITNSHFFVRIAESDEPLWSKRRTPEASSESSETRKTAKRHPLNAAVDKGSFDAGASGGMARNPVKCCSLSNGDIVVLLQVNIGVDFVQDPVLEILQFEKYEERNVVSENQENLKQDPCRDLLKWLLPLDNSIPPPSRPVSPPVSSNSAIRSTSTKSNIPASSGSQIMSHFRSYSMSSLPPNNAPPQPITNPNPRRDFNLEDWDRSSSNMFDKNKKGSSKELLSFRGVSLEPERFSVRCGLEGIYIPGRRWRRKVEIIQPIEIHSFAAECNTEDLLCVQIKNVSPDHAPDIVIYLDAITIVFEEASNGGPPLSLPITCIEAGTDHSLPNLALRRGEEHSFILKPASSMWRSPKGQIERSSYSSQLQAGSASSSLHLPSNMERNTTSADQYAVLVSCRCNYTESRLFFKQTTSWRPCISRDLLISVASEMSTQSLGSNGRVPQLPVQVLTLQASNLTSQDLTLTVSAPASFTSPPSVVSLNSSPSTPLSPFDDTYDRHGIAVQRLNSVPIGTENERHSADSGPRSISFNEQLISLSDVLPRNDLGCTHLWLQSRVPLGCVPSRSTATIKLELLPLTDGIITLDSLQIDVKEKGLSYVPEHSLKINATSSIATGIA